MVVLCIIISRNVIIIIWLVSYLVEVSIIKVDVKVVKYVAGHGLCANVIGLKQVRANLLLKYRYLGRISFIIEVTYRVPIRGIQQVQL